VKHSRGRQGQFPNVAAWVCFAPASASSSSTRVVGRGGSEAGQLSKSGQHDRTPVTTKHEKRLCANPLFAVSYGSFQGRPFRSLRGFERNRDFAPTDMRWSRAIPDECPSETPSDLPATIYGELKDFTDQGGYCLRWRISVGGGDRGSAALACATFRAADYERQFRHLPG